MGGFLEHYHGGGGGTTMMPNPDVHSIRKPVCSAFVEILQSLKCKIFQYTFRGQYPMKFLGRIVSKVFLK